MCSCNLHSSNRGTDALRWHVKKTNRAWRWWWGRMKARALICLSELHGSLSFFQSEVIINSALMKSLSQSRRDFPQLRPAGERSREDVYNSWQEITYFHSYSTLMKRQRGWWGAQSERGGREICMQHIGVTFSTGTFTLQENDSLVVVWAVEWKEWKGRKSHKNIQILELFNLLNYKFVFWVIVIFYVLIFTSLLCGSVSHFQPWLQRWQCWSVGSPFWSRKKYLNND